SLCHLLTSIPAFRPLRQHSDNTDTTLRQHRQHRHNTQTTQRQHRDNTHTHTHTHTHTQKALMPVFPLIAALNRHERSAFSCPYTVAYTHTHIHAHTQPH